LFVHLLFAPAILVFVVSPANGKRSLSCW